VSRPVIEVRSCREEDLPAVVRMWEEMRAVNTRMARTGLAPSLANAAELLDTVRSRPGYRLVVAVADGVAVGMACFTHQPFAPLYEIGAVHVTYLHVAAGYRRRGVGHALVAAAAAYAEEVEAEQVVAAVVPGLREPNRFFARLGFGPVVTSRAVSTIALRRRLSAESRLRPVEDLLALRRSLRSRTRVVREPDLARSATVPDGEDALPEHLPDGLAGPLPVPEPVDGWPVLDPPGPGPRALPDTR
jgi:L-amino acid N-acyltransferase YncA